MRKKTFNHMCDTVFWYLVYMLPLVGFLLQYLFGGAGQFLPTDFGSYMGDFGVSVDNPIFTALTSLFGDNGILPLIGNGSGIFEFITWFASTLICHLAVDFIIFIPRLAHKWLGHFYKE